ncbi:unnamed protein product [Notodromas monacha]|uniref:Down syndrome cell adhesion molecule-like protein Dscam2 n=1 Tax=Notodromas monacha TaxID=399045 RepID=A0A7R9GHK1_9CRUS|nr:unnamed protein product [Notodromas monacha]CAG0920883.1 unnamed protein product [Notodromas monacha]
MKDPPFCLVCLCAKISAEPPVAPSSVFVKNSTSNAVVISWDTSRQSSYVLTGFVVDYKEVLELWKNAQSVQLDGNATEAVIDGLSPHTRYEIRIAAVNDLGVSPHCAPLLVETDSALPSAGPLEVQAVPRSPQEIFLQWIPPSQETWNGHVQGYKVGHIACAEMGNGGVTYLDVPVEPTSLAQSASVKGLRPYTNYCFTVRLVNDVGDGPDSLHTEAATLQDVPGPVRQLKCEPGSSQSLSVSWSPPPESERNGEIIGYRGFYRLTDSDYDVEACKCQKNEASQIWSRKNLVSTEGCRFRHIRMPTSPDMFLIAAFRCGSLFSHLCVCVLFPVAPEEETVEFPREAGVLLGLRKFSNYSVTLAAVTRAGVGVKAEPLTCSTDEDVPDPPRHVKAAPSSGSAATVAWSAPTEANGVLVGYTVMQFAATGSRRRPPSSSPNMDGEPAERELRLPAGVVSHELDGLDRRRRYRFCITAHTRIGQSEPACSAPVSPAPKVPAAVLTFGGIVSATAQSDTVLPCQHVGVPSPQVQWELPNGIRVTSSETPSNRLGIMPDGKLVVRDLARNDTGNYTCTASNDQGTDAVSHRLVVKSLPSAPKLHLESVTATSISVGWTRVDPGNSEMKKFVVNFRKTYGGRWEESSAGKHATSFTVAALDCGTEYQIYVAAVNEIGAGKPSIVLNAVTKGDRPPPATPETILAVNATSAVLNFKTWQSPECPIQRFKVQYKAAASNWDWILVGDSFGPDSYVPIRGLAPGTTYIISLTAFNPAGKTTLLHHFITKSLSGDSVRPAMPSSNEAVSSNDRGLLYQARFWLPLCTVLLALVSVVAGVTYCVRARRLHRLGMQLQLVHDDLNAKHGPAPGSGHHHLQVNRSDIRGSFSQGKVAKAEPQSPAYVPAHLGNLGTTNDDVYPYATYHEIMQHQSTDFNKLLSEAPPPPRCLIHPPEALKMSQMMVSPVPQGKLTNTYVTEAVAVAGNKRHGGNNNKRHSRHQQQQQQQQPRGRKRTSTNMPEEQLEDVLMEQDKMLFRRHSQPASESPSSDSSGPECLVDNESELSATLSRIQCSRPGNTGRPHRPKSMAFQQQQHQKYPAC